MLASLVSRLHTVKKNGTDTVYVHCKDTESKLGDKSFGNIVGMINPNYTK